MKRMSWKLLLALFLIISSVFIYIIHYAIFSDPRHIFMALRYFMWVVGTLSDPIEGIS
jgi:hypothetical protein